MFFGKITLLRAVFSVVSVSLALQWNHESHASCANALIPYTSFESETGSLEEIRSRVRTLVESQTNQQLLDAVDALFVDYVANRPGLMNPDGKGCFRGSAIDALADERLRLKKDRLSRQLLFHIWAHLYQVSSSIEEYPDPNLHSKWFRNMYQALIFSEVRGRVRDSRF